MLTPHIPFHDDHGDAVYPTKWPFRADGASSVPAFPASVPAFVRTVTPTRSR
jgi:hypothetical protein